MRIPLFGRLGAMEWPVLIFSLLLVVVEYILSFITSILPVFVIHFFDVLTSSLFRVIPTSGINKVIADPELDDLVNHIANADGFVEMCKLFGYDAEEHIVKTTDGYLLGIHRIGGPKNSNWRGAQSPIPKPVVYLHHGLLMNSEIWVCNIDPKRSLPFVLADMGYDVWLGNNRGNKYSKKHVTHHPNSIAFWNFSIDDFALYDIPDTISYILYIVNQKDLVYIGFSQGSAQAFATLSINPELNKKVRLFIALAPAMAPPGIQNTIVDSLMRASPSLIYLFFGRKAILKSATFWQSIMYPPLFVHTIDTSISSLFKWHCRNISYAQKLAAYPHLYSFTSVKSVVHWFQIIRSGRFHMYDDDVESPFFKGKYFYRVASFPTQNITTPILLLYGKSDSLVDIDIMLSELPKGTSAVGFDTYEHLDLIWGDEVDTTVYPYVFSALKQVDHNVISSTNTNELVSNSSNNIITAKNSLPLITLKLPTSLSPSSSTTTSPSTLQSSPTYPSSPSKDPYLANRPITSYSPSVSSFKSINEDDEKSSITTSSSSNLVGLGGNTSPRNGRHRSKPSSSSSSSDSLSYNQLANKISSSFSSTGINFGSSQPVVEVIHSDSHGSKN